MTGATPKGVGPSQAEPVPVSSLRASVPSAIEPWEIEAQQAAELGVRYRMIQEGEYGCSKIICTFPHDGNCWCFNKALAEHTAQAIEARRAETQGGSVHESAVRQDAPDTPDLSTPLPSGSIER